MVNRAIFLDRDGTLNEDPDPGYLADPEKVVLFPKVAEVLSRLKKEFNYLLIVVSNQSGIGRGLLTASQVDNVNSRINSLLERFNVAIDKFYYCPYHPDFNTEEECKCRKPATFMIMKAVEDFNIDLTRSFIIGDSVSDIKCGDNAGIKSILVLSGNGRESLSILQNENNIPRFVATDFEEAGNFIFNEFNGAAC
ncbi:MAG: HAD family hydrolase [Ignavibacteria bacterium]|jgi:histidinol-phosphate phosphatase family protein